MLNINRIAWIIGLCILLSITYDTFASGYFPEPESTNDPNGNLEPEAMYTVACELYDEYVEYNYPLFDNEYLIEVWNVSRGGYYWYWFYEQDLIDICMVMRSI